MKNVSISIDLSIDELAILLGMLEQSVESIDEEYLKNILERLSCFIKSFLKLLKR